MFRQAVAGRRRSRLNAGIKALVVTAALAATVSVVEARGGLPAPPGLPGLPGLPPPPNVNVHVSGAVPAPSGGYIYAGTNGDDRGWKHGRWKHKARRHGHDRHHRHW